MLRSSERNFEEKNDEKSQYESARVRNQKKAGGVLNEDLMFLSQDDILRELGYPPNPTSSSSPTQPGGAKTNFKGSRNAPQELLPQFN